jgi:hypothetical protein
MSNRDCDCRLFGPFDCGVCEAAKRRDRELGDARRRWNAMADRLSSVEKADLYKQVIYADDRRLSQLLKTWTPKMGAPDQLAKWGALL